MAKDRRQKRHGLHQLQKRSSSSPASLDYHHDDEHSKHKNGLLNGSAQGIGSDDHRRLPSSNNNAPDNPEPLPFWTNAIGIPSSSSSSNGSESRSSLPSSTTMITTGPHRQIERWRRRYGTDVIRRRAFVGDTATTSTTEVLHRQEEAYVECLFLDAHDKVLAMDGQGSIDVIRLTDLRQSQNRRQFGRQTQTRTANTTPPPPPPQEVASSSSLSSSSSSSRLHLAHFLANDGSSSGGRVQDFSSVHLQSLAEGSMVAVGMSDDTMCFLDLDADDGGDHRRISSSSSSSSSLAFEHVQANSNLSFLKSILPFSSPSNSIRSLRAWRTQQPNRMYYRDRRNPQMVLSEQLKRLQTPTTSTATATTTTNDMNNLQERQWEGDHDDDHWSNFNSIAGSSGPRVYNHIHFVPHLTPSHGARWDVFESRSSGHVASSVFHVAHIDSDSDAFWVQTLDGRMDDHGTNNSRANNSSRRPTLLVDKTSRDRPGTREEHVTAIAMVSDLCLATAHISCPNYGMTEAHEFFDRNLAYSGHGMETCVKLWDLRMISSYPQRTRLQQPVNTFSLPPVSLPCFPDADAVGVEPADQVRATLTQKGSLAFKQNSSSRSGPTTTSKDGSSTFGEQGGGCDYAITELSASKSGTNNGSTTMGSLMVSTQSRSRSSRVEHHRMDLGRMEVTRKVYQTNQSLGCHPIFAVAESHEFMVCCSKGERHSFSSSSTSLDIFNVRERPSSSLSSRGKKRFIGGPPLDNSPSKLLAPSSSSLQLQRDPSWSFQMKPHLLDGYGVETDLSCLSMNRNGTAILGGSKDGDLFLWRGV